MAGLARGGGYHLVEMKLSEPGKLVALAWREGARIVLWLANLTAEPLTIRTAGFQEARLKASFSDPSTFEKAVVSLDALEESRRSLEEADLNLDAYAVVRVEVDNKEPA
jgi:hypothetical protein